MGEALNGNTMKPPLVMMSVAWGGIGLLMLMASFDKASVETSTALGSPASRTLQQAAEDATVSREPGGLVGNIGVGLFLIILFGAFSVVGCLFSEGSENPGLIRFGIGLLYTVFVILLFVLPKKKRGETLSTAGQFHSTWLWMNVITYVIMGVGFIVAVAAVAVDFLAVPTYALEEDRMARKG